MKTAAYKSLSTRKIPKTDREHAILLGLIELYLKTGKPIGSHTLQEHGFKSLSSATIRNYFSKMEEQGYLKQQHTSGGRIPTDKALRLYADAYQSQGILEKAQEEALEKVLSQDTKEVAAILHQAADVLGDLSKCAVFLSAPRFDQDFIQDIKMVQLDSMKILSILITDFGLIRTETLYMDHPVDSVFLRTFEEYCLWRLNKGYKPLFRTDMEAKMAQRLYNEIMVRHVVGYANFPNEEIWRTGLSKLLAYPPIKDPNPLPPNPPLPFF